MSVRRPAALAVFLAALAVPGAALAAPPPNDNRASAENAAELPATFDGTTVEATVEEGEPLCTESKGSVWYRVTAPGEGRLIVGLDAGGDLDASVEVYRAQRSRLSEEACEETDEDGDAAFSVDASRGQTFLVRIAPLEDSVDGPFRLTLQFGRPEATAPGPRLGPRGASGTLERVIDPDAAYSVALRPGRTYRFNLAVAVCAELALYAPGTDTFSEDSPVKRRGCGGYMTFTPDAGEGGVYSLYVHASRRQRRTSYHLQAALTGADDTAPGRFIRNNARVRGRVNGRGVDVVDLYRFDVTRRSELELGISSDADVSVSLVTAGGRRLGTDSDELTRRVKPGRYFAVVRAGRRAAGGYRLTRISRAITRTRTVVQGARHATAGPGATVSLGARITPGVAGPVTLYLYRFDPLEGWLFMRTYRLRASGGSATVAFRPPGVGRYRVRSEFAGTRSASPSRGGYATLTVQAPLQE